MQTLPQNKQYENFSDLFGTINSVKNKFDSKNISSKEEWTENSKIINNMFDNEKLLKNFLNIQHLQSLFFVNSQGEMLRQQLHLLELLFNENEINKYTEESKLGNPPFISGKYQTTHNTIHHLYHLCRYYKQCSKSIKDVETVVEWGGGYGNMCKVFYNFASNLKTYIIFDLPNCLTLQYIYLASLYGKENIKICDDGKIEKNKINLMNFEHLNEKIDGDLFLSNWALSESPTIYHNAIENLNWFNCEKLLLSFHQCGDHIPFMKESTNLGFLAKKYGAKIKNVKIIPGINLYAFR